jgi:hypothetical protein
MSKNYGHRPKMNVNVKKIDLRKAHTDLHTYTTVCIVLELIID